MVYTGKRKLKKGIAFFSTLLILTLVTILMLLSIRESSEISTRLREERFLSVENILLSDVIPLVKRVIKSIPRSLNPDEKEDYYAKLFSTLMTLKNPVQEGEIDIFLNSSEGRVNINQIQDTAGNFDFYEFFFKNFLINLEITDPELFTNVFRVNIEGGTDQIDTGLNLAANDRDFLNQEIKTWKRFFKILDRYVALSKDINAASIDWRTLIRFEGNGFNINYAPLKVIQSLPGSSPGIADTVARHDKLYYKYADLGFSVEEKVNFDKVGVFFHTGIIHCKVVTTLGEHKAVYKFLYDISTEKTRDMSITR